ncbi:potassium transporter TrkA [Siculibacillus lacustris]|uniref:Potassium transporter TrkA n=1 Tax=Siculibacillus lacustris TaxID=1549641 RepID=A0A4Q9VIC5_9HYPH|nr:monovalent cation:proton antiporter-2 (CPA2) family protein [Siculibacillus lacustris]TBW34978.1 potassium transporter TrkA [Siculibacillus lacustris]
MDATVAAVTLPAAVPFARPLLLIAAAMVAVPLFKRLGLGSVLGYLAAGIVIGPAVLRLFVDPAEIMQFAELGIVMFLFLIGLQLRPSRLWSMRRDIFGLGTAQIVATAVAVTWFAMTLFDLSWKGALVAGVGLSLSSTALVMQMIEERSETQTTFGSKAFAILLMQDLAIVPLLALLPLLSPQPASGGEHPARALLEVIAAVGGVVAIGRWVLNPMFRLLAASGAREIMTAAALMVVIGAASLVSLAGLSMATGAFLAGVMLAESNFRNQLQVDIEPFRGLLLGLFFMSVGMTVDLEVIAGYWDQILGGVAALIVVKVVVLYLVMRLARSGHADAVRVSLFLAQGGEFGFVLYSAAVSAKVMPAVLGSGLITVVTLSMAATPLVVGLRRLLLRRHPAPEIDADLVESDGQVVLIGFGRFGQVLSQFLVADGIDLTIIDTDPAMIRSAGRFGFKIHYGDGTRLDVLRAAGVGRAKLVAIATEAPATTNRIVDLVKAEFPLTRVFARSYDRAHALTLLDRNVDFQVRETFESALVFGRETLKALGLDDDRVGAILDGVRRRDAERMVLQHQAPTPGALPAPGPRTSPPPDETSAEPLAADVPAVDAEPAATAAPPAAAAAITRRPPPVRRARRVISATPANNR